MPAGMFPGGTGAAPVKLGGKWWPLGGGTRGDSGDVTEDVSESRKLSSLAWLAGK